MRHLFKERSARHDVYTQATNAIITALEHGVRPWHRPWDAENTEGRIMRPLRFNGVPYTGINTLMLWVSANNKGFTNDTWMTFLQAHELGGHIRKGEHGTPVVYADKIKKTEHTDDGDVEKLIPFLKQYTVFNVNQIENLPEKYYGKPPPRLEPVQRIEHAEEFFANSGADIRIGGNRAFYAKEPDYIRMPPIETFENPQQYYSTLAHETTHWTNHPGRVERDFGRKKWGDEGYAMEELVAELGGAFLSADLDLDLLPKEDNAAYIGSWIKVLRDDNHAIFTAAAHAQRAADYLHTLQAAAAADLAPIIPPRAGIQTQASV